MCGIVGAISTRDVVPVLARQASDTAARPTASTACHAVSAATRARRPTSQGEESSSSHARSHTRKTSTPMGKASTGVSSMPP